MCNKHSRRTASFWGLGLARVQKAPECIRLAFVRDADADRGCMCAYGGACATSGHADVQSEMEKRSARVIFLLSESFAESRDAMRINARRGRPRS